MKMTDGKRTVDITIRHWNGSGFDPEWSNDYFNKSGLPYDAETDTYTVPDVQYCIDMAKSTDGEGACVRFDLDGNPEPDEDMCVDVEEL